MIIKKLPVGMIMANCYIVGCEQTKLAVVIDPGDETERILMALAEDKLTAKYIVNTHGHFDHTGGNKSLKEATGAELIIHKGDSPFLAQLSRSAASFGMSVENSPPPDRTVDDGDEIECGTIRLKVIHTPGHSPGGIALLTGKDLFVGDTLFSGSIGRTDLPGGDFDTLIDSVRRKLYPLGDDITVYCGHGPETTIEIEKKTNPFVSG